MKLGRFIGCMTGTSVDGLDLALIDVTHPTGADEALDENVTVVAACTLPLPSTLRDALLRCAQPDHSSVELLGACDAALGEFIGTAINHWLRSLSVEPSSIRAIGSHGQTVRHRPSGGIASAEIDEPFTVQIGDPNHIAELTGIDTIADFRRRDMAAGGQGAPLAPAFHQVLFGDRLARPCIVNIGGISNISPLDGSFSGFDSGPGNCLMDEWFSQHHHDADVSFDLGGAWAASGRVDKALLEQMLSDPFFRAPAPKSTGREYFNQAWINAQITSSQRQIAPQDVQATLAALTAQSIAQAITAQMPDVQNVPVCGGGRRNEHVLGALKQALTSAGSSSSHVAATEHWEIDGDSVEAAAFGWLAYRRIYALSGNLVAVTGATGARVLGAIYPA
ncbi:MAG: anhydro-N-acetylmuramic acid kinase [Proteobacteria bacterium]|nr:anhydro-N-acetylmuramic acid kinase [Pseudomonadota bacterium]